jgi:putative transposase
MGLEVIYNKIKPKQMGRDKFIKIFQDLGYGVRRKRRFTKTTQSNGVKRFPNRLEHIELNGINQCFVSDITYYDLKNNFYYITFIMDLYNREVVGFSISKSLRTIDTTLPALEMVVYNRGKNSLKDAIFHSDGGGQYYADVFLKRSNQQLKMINSMGKECYENPHAERLNGVLKNDYIIPYGPQSFKQLIKLTAKAVKMYNTEKPHKALNGKTPIQCRSAA